ncbi:MAG: hypothetical protein JNJ73_05705 [Hyphomonadaceae bacterium]|nr:hypothetical protein [Hyphomonadaceae bacterium]
MHDDPAPEDIMAAVAAFLREGSANPNAAARAFQERVAQNAVDLAQRQIADPTSTKDELESLLGKQGDERALTAELARRIRAGEIGEATSGLMDYLWRTTIAKVRVDQPNYAGLALALKMKREA